MLSPIPQQGEIWLVYTPGQPADPHQPRPALVVSEDVRNRRTDDVIVVPVFSSGRLGPTRVSIGKGVGGLAHDSVLFCEEITTVDRSLLVEGPLGRRVPMGMLHLVLLAVRRALGEVLPDPRRN